MAITTEGVKLIAQTLIGNSTPLDSTHAYIGVGNGSSVFDASQVDLVGSIKIRKPMDVGYPNANLATVTFRSTFQPSEANFAWNEWGIFNAETGGVMLNRVVESNGTKQGNQTWVLEVAITFNVGN